MAFGSGVAVVAWVCAGVLGLLLRLLLAAVGSSSCVTAIAGMPIGTLAAASMPATSARWRRALRVVKPGAEWSSGVR